MMKCCLSLLTSSLASPAERVGSERVSDCCAAASCANLQQPPHDTHAQTRKRPQYRPHTIATRCRPRAKPEGGSRRRGGSTLHDRRHMAHSHDRRRTLHVHHTCLAPRPRLKAVWNVDLECLVLLDQHTLLHTLLHTCLLQTQTVFPSPCCSGAGKTFANARTHTHTHTHTHTQSFLARRRNEAG